MRPPVTAKIIRSSLPYEKPDGWIAISEFEITTSPKSSGG
jgi:hypothetical protein